MNDEAIKKALEEFQNRILKTNLSYHIFESEMMAVVNALDLINRQQAVIERYEKESNEQFDKMKLLDDRTKQRYAELFEEAKEFVRTEAIKEFAERLKESIIQENDLYVKCAKNLLSTDYQQGYEEKNNTIIKFIDNLLAEKAGGENA